MRYSTLFKYSPVGEFHATQFGNQRKNHTGTKKSTPALAKFASRAILCNVSKLTAEMPCDMRVKTHVATPLVS